MNGIDTIIRSHLGNFRMNPASAGFPVKPPSQYGSPSISTAGNISGRHAEARTNSTEISVCHDGGH